VVATPVLHYETWDWVLTSATRRLAISEFASALMEYRT
jgi:hypothetical protein